MVKLRTTQKTNGQQVAWFRSSGGLRARVSSSGKVSWGAANRRVGTSLRATTGEMNWSAAKELKELAQYGIQLMLDRTEQGIGSDDRPMAPLGFGHYKTRYSKSGQKMVQYGARQSYAALKERMGLQPIRDLRGPGAVVKTETTTGKKRYIRSGSLGEQSRVSGLGGTRGHMLDDIRVTYVDDTRATLGITTQASRTKARANEDRSQWWGWSPGDMGKLMGRMAEVLKMSFMDIALTAGFNVSRMLASDRWAKSVRSVLRRAA